MHDNLVNQELVFSVSDFVALLNQTLEYAYPSVVIVGELANFRVSKNRWVYFDLKDELSSVKFFGTVYQLPGPLEDGMMLQVRGQPRLHPQYGFSVTFQTIRLVGEGAIKRAAALLETKLAAEGLFDPVRKRSLPYPPRKIGLITSSGSAAYHDFTKILDARWGGVEILLADVQVQGETAPGQLVAALEYMNSHEEVDTVVLIRGGGSPEDLAAFSTEQVTRAVAASRTPTLVAIGHEVDVSLAELAADKRASTPSNAAELLVPDKREVLKQLSADRKQIEHNISAKLSTESAKLIEARVQFNQTWNNLLRQVGHSLQLKRKLLEAFNPEAALRRGYAIVRRSGQIIQSGKMLKPSDKVSLQLSDAHADAIIEKVRLK